MIHKIELPFFEQYKISKNPWPWDIDKNTPEGKEALSEWNELVFKTTLWSLFNNIFSNGCMILFLAWLYNW